MAKHDVDELNAHHEKLDQHTLELEKQGKELGRMQHDSDVLHQKLLDAEKRIREMEARLAKQEKDTEVVTDMTARIEGWLRSLRELM